MQLIERLARLRNSATGSCDNTQRNRVESSRAEADALLSAADVVIDRTLSGDSEAFLVDCVQDGGQ